MRQQILKNVPLAPLTTLKVGGPASHFVRVEREEDVAEAFAYASRNGLEVFVLGGGSNILVSDQGFDGLVIQIAVKGVTHEAGLVTAAAGEDWDSFVAKCVADEQAGVECVSGIPGSVGGTPVQNVGAYGQEVAETIVSVRCFDRSSLRFVELANEQCGFEYRKSIFNSSGRGRHVVVSVTYKLLAGGKPKIVYKDLIEHFGRREPSLGETRDAVLRIRRAKSMLIDPADPNSLSAGSFFKNPIVPRRVADELAEAFMIQKVPHFRVNEQQVKIPAAWLIEQAGFSKGYVHGNAGISSNHTLAIINRGGATAAEVLELKGLIETSIRDRFGIELQPEPILVGF